ncbi:stage IV sporulation protein B [Caloramator quimbayensis]|uniref:Stage IV sporulation protein B n=1 Tax=Caloramator quimbayensis TaxID=1147123 RepID=A0A1T4WXP4_9CLOT|nr:stage IV sporulation protein B [Caloramator quimbayensis]
MKSKYLSILTSFSIVIALTFFAATINVISLPDDIKISGSSTQINLRNNSLKNNLIYKIDSNSSEKNSKFKKDTLNISIKLFGIIPVKKMTLSIVPEFKVIPGGQPIGVKINMDGILVVGFSDIDTQNGWKQSPALTSGINIGDRIIEINGVKVNRCSELSSIINNNKDSVLKIKVINSEKTRIVDVKPVETKNKNEYKIGLWVRDSTAGVGTLTFYDDKNNIFGALGHPISDVDTMLILPISSGKIYNAKIVSVEQGVRGRPGELRGTFSMEDEIGDIEKNTSTGIYGKINSRVSKNIYNYAIPIALQNEIKEGPAKILTSIDGNEVKEYSIYIEKLTQQSKPNSKSMIIRVTDSELLRKTGGIVQGMSGSPIIQDGKLAGAVTHVFVNKPDMGYGIYIEWMLKEAGINF